MKATINKIGKIVAVVSLLGFVGLSVLKTVRAKRGIERVNKCYSIESKMMAMIVTNYYMDKFELQGVYRIKGVMFIFPFNTTIPQEVFEEELLPLAEEINCQTGKRITKE